MPLQYESEYVNSVLAAKHPDGEQLTLVAGTHSDNFPYFGDKPWDNVLLSVGHRRFEQTVRDQGFVQFGLNTTMNTGKEDCTLLIRGSLTSLDDGTASHVCVEVTCVVTSFWPMQEGKRYNFLDLAWIPGLRWHPFSVDTGWARIQIGHEQWRFDDVTGQIEHGLQSNFRSNAFAFYYDYRSLVHAGSNPYTFLSFQTHAVGSGLFSRLLDRYLVRYASEELTFARDRLLKDNPHGAGVAGDVVVQLENVVDLKLCRLRRQLVGCSDRSGARLTGLREIFECPP